MIANKVLQSVQDEVRGHVIRECDHELTWSGRASLNIILPIKTQIGVSQQGQWGGLTDRQHYVTIIIWCKWFVSLPYRHLKDVTAIHIFRFNFFLWRNPDAPSTLLETWNRRLFMPFWNYIIFVFHLESQKRKHNSSSRDVNIPARHFLLSLPYISFIILLLISRQEETDLT